jgi:hypothetical protein
MQEALGSSRKPMQVPAGALKSVELLPPRLIAVIITGGCSEELSGILGHYRSFHYGAYRVVYRVFEDIRTVSVAGLGKKK